MIDTQALGEFLRAIGLDDWPDELSSQISARMSSAGHGDFDRWRSVIESLHSFAGDPAGLKAALMELSPWRKGPFDVAGVTIDAEWQSDWKWARLAEAIEPLTGRNILDVGCGNGYYALEMRRAGANAVLGIDPTLLYAMQFLAVNHFIRDSSVYVLPLRLAELPPQSNTFDTTFSMGVLYHQRSPIEHLRQLHGSLRPGGQLVLETLFLPGEESHACTPPDRYARMKNVWLLPTIAELMTWLNRCGFRGAEVADRSITTTDEQRSTEWMPFESLAEALDPDDPTRTVEDWPAPRRVVITASK